ncbi:MAG: glycosyltransferase family 2 protein [Planctomycetes bacterium]|nr:glycosyltransferase family 2 protein [Planctomycetota bacterium]MCK5578104.1 glycosyltransferase family 2 protein [Planctomycetota bacterium]
MPQPPISACVVTFNEKDNIKACLESLKWVDEIVVIDSFSTDGTTEICRQYTDKVIQHQWPGFVKQKNYALSQATHDWVLSLDSDERVSPELKEAILKEWKKESWKDHDGFYISRRAFYLGRWIKHGGWYPDDKLRLFRKSKGAWDGIDPHDKIFLKEEGSRTKKIDGEIDHYTYKNISEQLKTIDRFSDASSGALIERGVKFSLLKLIFSAPVKFIETYVFKAGFLDGLPGFIIAVNSAFYTFNKYAKIWEQEKGK